jgi:hypothetical protein
MHDLLIIRNGCSITDDTKLFAQCLIGLRHRHAEHMDYHVTGLGVPIQLQSYKTSLNDLSSPTIRRTTRHCSPRHTALAMLSCPATLRTPWFTWYKEGRDFAEKRSSREIHRRVRIRDKKHYCLFHFFNSQQCLPHL